MSKETYNNNEITQEEMFDIIIDGIRAYQEYLNKYKFDAEASFASSFEVLDYLLEEWPEFDINTTVIYKPIGMYSFEHYDDTTFDVYDKNGDPITYEYPNRIPKALNTDPNTSEILFCGRLIHYAILKNDLEAVDYLRKKGCKLITENDDEDYCVKYAQLEQSFRFLDQLQALVSAVKISEEHTLKEA